MTYNWLKPTKANIMGTVFVYLALVLSSVWDFLLYSTLFSEELRKIAESARGTVEGASVSFFAGFSVMVLSPAMQLILLYIAVSLAIHLAKTKYSKK
jgi:uncharacterized membrane protein YdjX (TVP38/TMEM64 family)